MVFLQVKATAGDKEVPENIVYFLRGQDQTKFDINKTTGEIFVLKVMFVPDHSLLISPTFKHHYLCCK